MVIHPLIDSRIAGSGEILTVDETTSLSDYSLVSGARPFVGTVGGIFPTESAHLVTKEYVDLAVAGLELELFLDNLDSTINDPITTEDYFSLQTTETGVASTTLPAYASLGQGDDQEVLSYISGASLPFAELQIGIVQVHLHARKNNTGQKDTVIFAKLYHRADDETETLIATTEDSAELTNTFTVYNLHGNLSNVVAFSATDRLLLKIRADVQSSGGGDAQIEVKQEGAEDSRISALVETDTLSNIFVRQDGTTPLTGDWAVGSKDITGIAALGTNDLTVDTGVPTEVTWETTSDGDKGLTGSIITDVAGESVVIQARKTKASGPSAPYLANGSEILNIIAQATFDGTNFGNSVEIIMRAGAAHHSGADASDIPGELLINVTPDGSNVCVNVFRIKEDGSVHLPQDNQNLKFGIGNDLLLKSDGTNGIITAATSLSINTPLITMGLIGSANDTVLNFVSSGNSNTITYDQSDDEFDFNDAALTTTGTLGSGPITTTDLQVNFANSSMGMAEVSVLGGALKLSELQFVDNIFGYLGSIKDALYIRGATVDPSITFSDALVTKTANMSFIRATDALTFNAASGGYIFDDTIITDGSIHIKEKAAAEGNTAAYGQLWVKNTVPCELWFTDDAGGDTQIV